MDGTSGLFYYDCLKEDVKTILLNSVKGGYVVNFRLIDLDGTWKKGVGVR